MRIFLIRHGESMGNLNRENYGKYLDQKVPLSEWGHEQALEAGEFLKDYLDKNPPQNGGKPRFWNSPFKRTRQTLDAILEKFGRENVDSIREDALLREQDFGAFGSIHELEEMEKRFPEEFKLFMDCMAKDGLYYATPPLGENTASVTDRMRTFINSQVSMNMAAGQEDMVIVAHGVANRAFEMAFMGRTPEWFNQSENPKNCTITMIEGDLENGFEVKTLFEGKDRPKHLPKDHKTKPYGEELEKSAAIA